MIHESYPWKQDLLKDADIIERWAQKRTKSERRPILLEKKIFLSAFVIRKLIENHKVTDDTKEHSISCKLYAALGSRVDLMNAHNIEKHYDLSSVQQSSISIKRFVNQIIHSLVFAFEVSEEEYSAPVSGFLVASDREKNNQLIGVDLADYIFAIRLVGEDSPAEMHAIRTEDDWNISLT